MEDEKLLHDLVVNRLKVKLSRDFKEVELNPDGGPDIRLGNYGMTMAVVEVETEGSISEDKAKDWGSLAESGTKLIIMVPKSSKIRLTDILWKQGLAGKASVGTYDLLINMP